MKNIINWTCGGFFRSIGRILAYIVIGGLIALLITNNNIKLPNVIEYSVEAPIKMVNSAGWARNMPYLEQTLMKDCTGANTCNNNISMTNLISGDDTYERRFVTNLSDITIASNGVLVMSNSGRFKSGYLYQVNYYLCASNLSNGSFYISAIDYDNPGVKHNSYELFSSSAMSPAPFSTNGESFNSCRKFESLIVPNANLNWVGIRLKNMSSVDFLYTIAYEINELGIYSSEVQTIVESAVRNATSSLVTSSQLNNATQEIQTEQQNTTSAIDNGFNQTCSNIYNINNNSNSCSGCSHVINTNGLTVTCSSGYNLCYYNYNLPVTPNTTYKVSYKTNKSNFAKIVILNSDWTGDQVIQNNGIFNSGSNSSMIVRFYSDPTNGPINYHDVMISKDTSTYCPFGSDVNRLDNTTNAINNMNDTLNDTDTSSDSSDTLDFFNNTNITSDSGLTSIVSSPLYVINNLVTGSSTDLCVTLKSKNICLPSGNILWGKTQRSGPNWFGSSDDISSGVNLFKAFFNLVVGGYICYKIVIGLILCIDRILTPTHTEIEVMKL